ncbi:Ig-like domain-containing protein [Hyalangium versicolor]|uniref:Ig-like domain-containing protein n=1 Tax=Hyalangium versicolor TaxID=2861190 RepID=UPI001CCA0632|nr:Ig-like domain-containing protein [Hyalangium versicolor]
MRTLVTLLVAGLVLASCEQSSLERANEAAASGSMTTAKSFVAGSRLLKSRKAVPSRYIVVLDEKALAGTKAEGLVQQLSGLHGAAVDHIYSQALQGFSATMTEAQAIRLSNDPRVRYVEEDNEISAQSVQSYPTWGLDRIDQQATALDQAYSYDATGNGVHVYVFDSGIRATHGDFGGRVLEGFNTLPDSYGSDIGSHGTAVAGTIGGAKYGVAKGVFLHSVRVLNSQGLASASQLIAGIDWITANHVKPAVANLSLSYDGLESVNAAIARSINAGIFYVLAVGNGNKDVCYNFAPRTPSSPMVVAAATQGSGLDLRADFSNYGPCVDLFAPGQNILSDFGNSDTSWGTIDGTSLAGAHVAGAAALILERHPQATPEQLKAEILRQASPKVAYPGTNTTNLLLYTQSCTGSDVTAPQVVLTGPSAGASLSGPVTLSATASDNASTPAVEFFLGNRMIGSVAAPPYQLTWDSSTASNGPAVLSARAYDSNCNQATGNAVSVTIQNVQNATYDATLGAPVCTAVGSRCDTMELLAGRGSMGPELHAPNTVGGSCADGTDGTYRASPSLERLVVTRSDGTPFSPGKEVRVLATVTASTNAALEALDLYVASDVSNPTWTRIDTLTPNSGGSQILSTTYLLPASGRHILRGVYRSGAGNNSACVPGPLNDHDDLVISVGPQEVDAEPPTVSITYPQEGATITGRTSLTVMASDNFGVQRVEVYDGDTLISTSYRTPYSAYDVLWDSWTQPNGPHTFTARAYDAAGQVTFSAPVHITVDNDHEPPQVTLTAPAEGATLSQYAWLSTRASDNKGVKGISITVDGQSVYYGTSGITQWNTRSVSNGPHVIQAWAYDAAGNASASNVAHVIVDNDLFPPQVTLTAPTSGDFVSGTVSLEASASDDRGMPSVDFYVDGAFVGTDTTAPYAFSWDSASVFNGSHTLAALAFDSGGNQTWSAPLTVVTNTPGNASYDSVLKVPRCDTVTDRCDTRNLVWKRNNELHSPNTLDGCVDGTDSTTVYSNRIRVLREDGTALATGKKVRIEVEVMPESNAWQYDTLALFTTADATHPSWTYLTTLKPTSYNAQTLSAEYVLPAGSLQAVRAVFGFAVGNQPCNQGTNAPFTDRDDVAFAVGQETDTVPPMATLTAPADGVTVSGTTVTLTATASDNFGVVAVDFYDGQTPIGTATAPPYSVTWNSRNGPNGPRTLTARARDLAGNAGDSAPVTVTADNDQTAPAVSISAPAAGDRVTGTVTITADATDNVGVTKVEFYEGSARICTDSVAPFVCGWIPGSTAGQRTLSARAYDAVGNVGISAPVTVNAVPELTPPTVSITWPSSGTTLAGAVTISASASDTSGVSKVEFLLDGSVLGTDTTLPYSLSWDTLTASNGSHTLAARATDIYGTVATSTAVTVLVDRMAPTVAITSPESGATVSGVVTLQASATDDQTVARVDFFVDGALLATDTTAPFSADWDSGSWGNGSHTLTAKAYDAANNQAPSTTVTVNANQPGSAVYDATRQVPTCTTFDSVCDTTNLVQGRYTTESHTPNSLNRSCSDGPGGTVYGQIDRLKVTSINGAPFAQGQRVRIDAYVSFASSSMVTIELYAASNATSPTWTNLKTFTVSALKPMVLSTEYDLPLGGLQAVRAQFLAPGSGTGSPCNGGYYNEVDDLVFAVATDPVATLTAPATNALVRGTVSLTATVATNATVAKVEFYDGTALLGTVTSAPYTWSWDTTSAADGEHSLMAKVYDSNGRVGTSSAVAVTVDNTPPGVALTAPAQSSFLRGPVTLSATANDTVGVTKVEFYDGTTLLGTSTAAPYTLSWSTGSTAGGAHTLTAKAYDAVGNTRTSASVEVTVDNLVPSVSISTPARNAQVQGAVLVGATASDNVGVTKVDFYLDGALLGTATTAPYAVSWNSTTVADGSHSLMAKAYDGAGNVGTSSSVAVSADNTLPDAALTSPAPGTLLKGSVVLTASASDTVGVTKVQFYDGTMLIGTAAASPYAVSWNTLGAADGAHTLTVKAYDGAGNVRTSVGANVTVDNTAPTTAISGPAQNARIRGMVSVNATASDTVGVTAVEFYAGSTLIGTASAAPYTVNWDSTTVADGSVTLNTRAYDAAGNVAQSAEVTITVDNTGPTVAITSPANGATLSVLLLSTTVSASASDNVGVAQVVFYDGASVLGTDTTAPYSVSWNLLSAARGNHTLTAKAYDSAGTVTTSTAVTVKVN